MSDGKHVHEEVRHRLEHSAEDRLDYIEGDQWVPYGQAEEGLELLRKTVTIRDQLSPRGVILLAESQMGKSAIIEAFRLENPASDNTSGEHIKVPVLVLQFPDSGGEGVYGEICRTLNVSLSSRPTALELRSEALGVMEDSGVQVLVIDELANVLTGHATTKQRNMNQIKFIMNERRRPVVLGVTPEAYAFIKADKQIRFRFKKHQLHMLRHDELSLFVKGWIYIQPLRKPSDVGRNFLQEVHERTGGHVGTIVLLLRELARKAIETGAECINEDVLKLVEFIDDSEVAMKKVRRRAPAKSGAPKKSASGSKGKPASKKASPKKSAEKIPDEPNDGDNPLGDENPQPAPNSD